MSTHPVQRTPARLSRPPDCHGAGLSYYVRGLPYRYTNRDHTRVTERLYYRDAYLGRFTARVTSASDDGRRVILDRSAFYPTSGGQPHDTGSIQGVTVRDVEDDGNNVVHIVANPIAAGADVECIIDWDRRYDLMQQHTGQHLLSALFADECGFDTMSVHFGMDAATLDLSTEELPADMLRAVERRANECVWENRPVTISFEDAASAQGLRKVTEREGEIRVVQIDALDRSACGGTHVRSTGEIGPVVLRRCEKMKRNTRVEFLCGARALQRCRRDYETLSQVATRLSAAVDDVPTLIEAQLELLRGAESERKHMLAELNTFRAKARYDETPANERGLRVSVEVAPQGGARADTFRGFALAFTALPHTVYMVASASPPSVLLASSADSAFDAGQHLKQVLSEVGGRGGGSPRLAQGSVPDASALSRVVQLLQDLT